MPKHILIVDDEQAILQSLKTLLESEGHEVMAVYNGEDAADLLRAQPFDLMITDIRMAPVDGMELLRLAHEIRPDMPSMVVSAYCSEETEKQARDRGSVAYIRKPFKVGEVLDAVQKVLSS